MSILAGISPWWWVAAAIAFGAGEMLTATTYLIWPAFAAAITGLLLWLIPQMGPAAQLTLFALMTIAFIFLGRRS